MSRVTKPSDSAQLEAMQNLQPLPDLLARWSKEDPELAAWHRQIMTSHETFHKEAAQRRMAKPA